MATNSKKLDHMTVRFPPSLAATVRDRAEAEGLSESAYIRQAILARLEGQTVLDQLADRVADKLRDELVTREQGERLVAAIQNLVGKVSRPG